VLQLVERLQVLAAALAAITDGVRPFLKVPDTVYQAYLGAQAENILGFLACNLTSQAVFHNIVAEPVEMEADSGGIFAIVKVGVDVLPVLAGTGGDGKIIM
jgi:hypothetical protein